jgi:putative ABC transport system permease protein
MLLWDILRSAVRSLLANRLRTFLTMLGVVIGVGAVVAMIALGEGARANVERSIMSMGTNLLFVRPGAPQRTPVRSGSVETLTPEDAEAAAVTPGIVAGAPEVSRGAQVKYYAANTNSSIMGTTPEYFSVRAFTFVEGEPFTEPDVIAQRRVAVLGSGVADELFGGMSPVGERIQIKGVSFTVVGLLASKGEAGWFNPDNQIVIPITTAQKALFGIDHLTGLSLQLEPNAEMEPIVGELERLLRERHRIREGAENDFEIRTQAEMVQRMGEITGTLTALMGGVAAVSLLVGGIGIMNIMLVSVRERTREIGVRKAVGARRRDILLQFLIEAVLVSVTGGVIGIAVGYGIAAAIARFGGWETMVPAYAVALSVATSVGIGILFGVWPAREAARLDPVEALRYE